MTKSMIECLELAWRLRALRNDRDELWHMGNKSRGQALDKEWQRKTIGSSRSSARRTNGHVPSTLAGKYYLNCS